MAARTASARPMASSRARRSGRSTANSSPPVRARVAPCGHRFPQPQGHAAQDPVPALVPQRVVDFLEPVEIEDEDGQRPARRSGAAAFQRLVHPRQEQGPVRQVGQGVVGGVIGRAVDQPAVLERDRHGGRKGLGQPSVVLGEGGLLAQPVDDLQGADNLPGAGQGDENRVPDAPGRQPCPDGRHRCPPRQDERLAGQHPAQQLVVARLGSGVRLADGAVAARAVRLRPVGVQGQARRPAGRTELGQPNRGAGRVRHPAGLPEQQREHVVAGLRGDHAAGEGMHLVEGGVPSGQRRVRPECVVEQGRERQHEQHRPRLVRQELDGDQPEGDLERRADEHDRDDGEQVFPVHPGVGQEDRRKHGDRAEQLRREHGGIRRQPRLRRAQIRRCERAEQGDGKAGLGGEQGEVERELLRARTPDEQARGRHRRPGRPAARAARRRTGRPPARRRSR